MRKILSNMLNENKQGIFVALGFILIFTYLLRFIIFHFPREIPFQLNLISTIYLFIICIIFVIMLKKLIWPTPSNLLVFIVPILQFVYMPLLHLNKFLLVNRIFKEYISKNLLRVLYYLYTYKDNDFIYSEFSKEHTNTHRIYLIFNILPKILLIFIFYVDVFYYHKLELRYSYLWLGLVTLIFPYIIYVIKETLKEYIYSLEGYKVEIIPKDPDDNIYKQANGTNITHTLPEALITIALSSDRVMYKGSVGSWDLIYKYFPRKDYPNRIRFPQDYSKEDINLIEKKFYDLMPLIISADKFIDRIDYFYTRRSSKTLGNNDHSLNIILYCAYLVCWLYILIISLPYFHLTFMETLFLQQFQDMLEPFSQTK